MLFQNTLEAHKESGKTGPGSQTVACLDQLSTPETKKQKMMPWRLDAFNTWFLMKNTCLWWNSPKMICQDFWWIGGAHTPRPASTIMSTLAVVLWRKQQRQHLQKGKDWWKEPINSAIRSGINKSIRIDVREWIGLEKTISSTYNHYIVYVYYIHIILSLMFLTMVVPAPQHFPKHVIMKLPPLYHMQLPFKYFYLILSKNKNTDLRVLLPSLQPSSTSGSF